MQRIIMLPAVIEQDAVAELKQWLGISRPGEDAMLAGLLLAALDLCEAFTGQAPLAQTVAERIALQRGWRNLTSRPVRALVSVELVGRDGTLSLLEEPAYATEFSANGALSIRIARPQDGQAMVVTMAVGIAPDWAALPDALRQGIIRLAAHYYRDRDSDGQRQPVPPPASVTALWRPWRNLRLA
jgi:uncharacterized phiE125 gp8 family phage protein